MESINASDFKARCLAILKEVEEHGTSVLIYRHGKAVAELRPTVDRAKGFPQEQLKGSVKINGDVLGPAVSDNELLPTDDWHED